MQIRTANAAGLGAHQHLARLELRVRHIAQHKTAFAEYRGAHGGSFLLFWQGYARLWCRMAQARRQNQRLLRCY
jgi:hypothetical protein